MSAIAADTIKSPPTASYGSCMSPESMKRLTTLPARRQKVNNDPKLFEQSQKGVEMSVGFGRKLPPGTRIWTGTMHPNAPHAYNTERFLKPSMSGAKISDRARAIHLINRLSMTGVQTTQVIRSTGSG